MFNADFKALIRPLIPWFIRKPMTKAWLYTLVKPLEELHTIFLDWSEEIVYQLSITGQIIYLEKLLNDKFNGGADAYTLGVPTGIYLSDPVGNYPDVYLWQKIESRPVVYLYNKSEAHTPPVYFYNEADYGANIDFVVNIPTAVGDAVGDPIFISQVKAWIEQYRIAGRKYTLKNY